VNQKIAVVAQDPFALVIAFDRVRQFAALFQLQTNLIDNGLRLAGVCAGADYKIVGEAGDSRKIQDFDVGCLLVLSGTDCNAPPRFNLFVCTSTSSNIDFGLRQKLAPNRYRTIKVSVLLRITALAVITISLSLAQTSTTAPPATAEPIAGDPTGANLLRADENDPLVIRAREVLDRVTRLVQSGALPQIRLKKAQEDVQDALDMSLLKQSMYSNDLLPEQADQMIFVAQRMVFRRERALADMQQLVSAGIISRSEAEASGMNLTSAQQELEWAESRAKLIQQMAASVKLQKEIASLESQAESHPEWNGKVFTKFEGSGVFTPTDLKILESAYQTHFSKPLPISANGETALHRSLGFDHRGRVDVAVTPDQPEGTWLMHYLQTKRIPYFAFRAAVPHQATGAHIHVGPGSTKLALTD
jgi:hypothetical protein